MQNRKKDVAKPVVISTWHFGYNANIAAWDVLQGGGSALDAVEAGARQCEADPEVRSVGYGGLPDSEGNVTLDACIMDHQGNCGSVVFLKNIKHPTSVARKVMELTPHVMLAGDGALEFALKHGFEKENLLTSESLKRWEEWKEHRAYEKLQIDNANHDTIGLLALDNQGNLSGACTTSGLAWKYYGRVGDSPIIGAGLYVDNRYGAACATGRGEAVMKMLGSFLIVELMRQGMSPQQACEAAVHRIAETQPDYATFQVGFLALSPDGDTGAFAIKKGFQYALYKNGENRLFNSNHLL